MYTPINIEFGLWNISKEPTIYWRTGDFLSDPSNMLICDWGTVIELEPAVMNIFNMTQGTDITLINKSGKKYFIYTETEELVEF